MNNKLSVLIPDDLYEENNCLDYLKFNSRLITNDTASSDYVEELDTHNIYIAYGNITNYLIEKFGSFEYFHYSTVLLKKLYSETLNDEKLRFYVNINKSYLNIIIFDGRKLDYINTFEYETKEDILYFILFVMEQNKMVNDETKINFNLIKIYENFINYFNSIISTSKIKLDLGGICGLLPVSP